jgi:ADP-ribose pyrophosphatase YjhB (NUDIX family)
MSPSTPSRTSGVVVLRGDGVLLVQPGETSHHERDVWGLPAGHVDDGETYLEAAIRETEEETGLVLEAADLTELPHVYVADLRRRDGTTEAMTWTVFATRRFSGTLRETPETTPVWVALSGLGALRLQGNVGNAIAQALAVMS